MNQETWLIMGLLALLIIKHFVCDWLLQCSYPYQYENKGTYGHPGGILHAGIAVAGTLVSLLIWTAFAVPLRWTVPGMLMIMMSTKVWLVLLGEFVFHYHVDWLKVRLNHAWGLDMTKDAAYWNLVGADQMVHYLSYVAIVIVLLS